MSRALSPSFARCYGLARVARVWKISGCQRLSLSQTDAADYDRLSQRGGLTGPIGFHRIIQRLGEAAKMPFPIHPHMLRHACGFKLANEGHDTRALQAWLGHKDIQHTVCYRELAPDRFRDFWR